MIPGRSFSCSACRSMNTSPSVALMPDYTLNSVVPALNHRNTKCSNEEVDSEAAPICRWRLRTESRGIASLDLLTSILSDDERTRCNRSGHVPINPSPPDTSSQAQNATHTADRSRILEQQLAIFEEAPSVKPKNVTKLALCGF